VSSSTLLVLDFDGVICDSIDECFASSWTAYHELYRKSRPPRLPSQARSDFAGLRPFIRTGEDFLLIQEMLASGTSVHDQNGFDEAAREAGAEKMSLFRELYYEARTALLHEDRDSWIAMNRIYPHMIAAFSLLLPAAPFYILSTKKPSFIAETLAAHHIKVPAPRILFTDREPKLETVERLLCEEGFPAAFFVEDQIDAIRGNSNPRIQVRLATWGYVRQEWLVPPLAVPLITPEGFLSFVQKEYGLPIK
jgi:phosphoglycolate phosphatase-like HAD superfamily hydrolase